MNEDQPIMWQLEQMFDFIHSYKKNYIWGTGHDQQMLAKYLDMCGTNLYDGYVCSDEKYAENKCNIADVNKISEIKTNADKKDIGFIVATWDWYFNLCRFMKWVIEGDLFQSIQSSTRLTCPGRCQIGNF